MSNSWGSNHLLRRRWALFRHTTILIWDGFLLSGGYVRAHFDLVDFQITLFLLLIEFMLILLMKLRLCGLLSLTTDYLWRIFAHHALELLGGLLSCLLKVMLLRELLLLLTTALLDLLLGSCNLGEELIQRGLSLRNLLGLYGFVRRGLFINKHCFLVHF